MRTTEGKPALEIRTQGDPELADVLARSMRFEERDDSLTHGFHTYPAGLHPGSAGELLALWPTGAVHDPFCGGGTVLVEAMRAGRRASGSDISPIAALVARGRTRVVDDGRLTLLRSGARRLAEQARLHPARPPEAVLRDVEPWYAPHVIGELSAIRRGIEREPAEVRDLLLLVLSAILVKVSWRESDTSARRVEHDRPPGTTAILFHKKARELARRLVDLRTAVPEGVPEPVVLQRDARQSPVPPETSLVLTSPPYPAVYDYLPIQELRAAWLGMDLPVPSEIGSRTSWRRGGAGRALGWWLADTEAWMQQVRVGLAPGGHLVVVLGDGLTEGGPIDSHEPTVRVAASLGLCLQASSSLARPDHARRSRRWEHVMVFCR